MTCVIPIRKIAGVYKTTKIHFLSPPPPSKIFFFIPVTTFSGGAVGYISWWQLRDTIFGGSFGIQHLMAAVG